MALRQLLVSHKKHAFISSVVLLFSSVIVGNAVYHATRSSERPHIIFILADDLGWNDVSFHGSPQIPTPNIDALAASGIILNNCYASPQCTPSRASLMTGRYPFNTGLQHFVIAALEPTGLPLEFKIMPEYLKKLGYSSHLIGKWHLGSFKKEYTPTHRGFDTFFGFWNGYIDYYDYTHFLASKNPNIHNIWGIDLHNGTREISDFRGKYATDIFTEKAVEIISKHDTSQPLFLFLSHLASHTGNSFHKMQAPPERVAEFKHIVEPDRRTFAGVVSSLDASVGKVFQSLHDRGMLDNSIIIFTSDNGGDSGIRGGQASNWPLRGMKMDFWEGGTRVVATLWSPLLKLKEPRVSTQLMYISDWLPTLYDAAGGNMEELAEIDGINMWRHLLNNATSPRTEVALNIDPMKQTAALRQGDYKLINGTFGNWNLWYGPSGRENEALSLLQKQTQEDKGIIKDILKKTGRWILEKPSEWQQNAIVECNMNLMKDKQKSCNPNVFPCLFNIREDPCEFNNLASSLPEVVNAMMNRIRELKSTSMPPIIRPVDPRGDPRCHNFTFVSWLDDERLTDCPWL